MDGSRQFDLEMLSEQLNDPRLSKRAKHEVEEIMYRIVHTSAPIASLREELIRATRGGDIPSIRKIQHHIQAIRQEETSGKEF